MPHSELKLDV